MKTVSILKYSSLVALAVLAGCKGNNAATEEATEVNSKVTVKVATAVIKPIEQVYEYTGTVEANKVNNISPSMPLRIDKILVEVGDRVNAGQLLAVMDNTQYRTAQVQLETQQQDLTRIENLLAAGAISQQEYDNLKAQVDIATTSIDNLMENVRLTSPISGIVSARNYDDGDMYGGQPLLTVVQMQPVKILVNVQEVFYPKVKKGMKVNVKLDTYPDQNFEGTVHLVHPTVNDMTRTFVVEVELPNKDMAVKPGMFARVEMVFDKIENVAIPDNSVQKQEGSSERYVYVIENGVANRRTVKLGRRVGNEFEVLSGVNDNEQVVISGMTRLKDKTEVEIQP